MRYENSQEQPQQVSYFPITDTQQKYLCLFFWIEKPSPGGEVNDKLYATQNFQMSCWLEKAEESDRFAIANIPLDHWKARESKKTSTSEAIDYVQSLFDQGSSIDTV